jgi:hypothetical protein
MPTSGPDSRKAAMGAPAADHPQKRSMHRIAEPLVAHENLRVHHRNQQPIHSQKQRLS